MTVGTRPDYTIPVTYFLSCKTLVHFETKSLEVYSMLVEGVGFFVNEFFLVLLEIQCLT